MLSAPGVGLIAYEWTWSRPTASRVTPVDYKRGRAPDVEERAWEPERVQLCAQAMILEENGYRVERGILYFIRIEAARRRPDRRRSRSARTRGARRAEELTLPAPSDPRRHLPLVDSPKCPRCSLVGICLPDETNLLRGLETEDRVRRLVPSRDDALLTALRAVCGRKASGGLRRRGSPSRRATARSAPCGSPIRHMWRYSEQCRSRRRQFGIYAVAVSRLSICRRVAEFYGITRGMDHKNVDLRRRQFAAAESADRSLQIAKRLVVVKIRNCRTLVRRNASEPPMRALGERLKEPRRVRRSDDQHGVAARRRGARPLACTSRRSRRCSGHRATRAAPTP